MSVRDEEFVKTTLYLVTNKVNGKRYVGITRRQDVRRRMTEHFSQAKQNTNNGAFCRAIRKYGRDVFVVETIQIYETRAEGMQAEIDYIREHRPEYNSTLGGDGRKGVKATPKMIETMRRIHSGNKYRLGKSHTAETREQLRKHAIAKFDLFKQYQHLGPKKSSKKVICIDDGETYCSASEAARAYNVAKSAVIELCLGRRNRKTIGGRRFKYVEAS